MQGRGERFETLDSLRGVAAAVVVVDHCLMTMPRFSDYIMRHATPPATLGDPVGFLLFHTPARVVWSGYSAVAMFFVLSGFVLSLPWLRGRPPRYASFAIRRVCRIYLPYLVAVAGAMALAALLIDRKPAGISQWFDGANWTEAPGPAAILAHVLMLGTHDSFDNVIWSLVHEMRVSLLFPLLLWPVLRFGLAGAAAETLGLAAVGAVCARLGIGTEGGLGSPALTVQFASLFVIGAALASQAGAVREWFAARPAALASLVAGAGLLVLGIKWPYRPELMLGLGAALTVAAALANGSGFARALLHPVPRWLGKVSYSLYLIHVPILVTAITLLHGRVPHAAILAGVVALSLLAAALFHRFVEVPSMRLGRRLDPDGATRHLSARLSLSDPSRN
jgi:peptidoglycan/LPS O-acetylase OafA/YrhL